MLIAVFLFAAVVEGPLMRPVEFFNNIPIELRDRDAAVAEKKYADFVRTTFTVEKSAPQWKVLKDRGSDFFRLEREVKDVMNYRMSAAGFHYQFPKGAIDWFATPVANNYFEWPVQLSRHFDLERLAKYYYVTKDEAVAKTWVQMLGSWMDQSVEQKLRTLDTGIRVPVWLRMVAAFAQSPSVSDHFLSRVGRSLLEQARFLRQNPSHAGNWLTFEMSGLLELALAHSYFKEAKEWREFAERQLLAQVKNGVYPDGFQIELTTGYHGADLSSYQEVIGAYRRAGEIPPEEIENILKKMFMVYPRLSDPMGRTPNLSDGGRENVRDWCQKALKYYPDDPVFKWFATRGAEGEKPDYLSDAFENAGYITFRSGWDSRAVWAFFDAGGDFLHGWHSHEDALGVQLTAYGKRMLVEAGTYRYDKSAMRKFVLTTAAHNSVLVDGLGQCRKLISSAKTFSSSLKSDFRFRTSKNCDFASAKYEDGYGERQINGITHRRTVFFFRKYRGLKPFLAVVDSLADKRNAKHTFDIVWHLNADEVKIDGNSFSAEFGGGVRLRAVSSAAEVFIDHKGEKNPLQGFFPVHSQEDNPEHRPVPTPIQRGDWSRFRRVVTVFQPLDDGEDSPIAAVEADAAKDVGSFELILKSGERIPVVADRIL